MKNKYLKYKTKGAILVTSLFFLLVLTLLGVSSMGKTIVQNKVSANDHNKDLAFISGETSLLAGEGLVGSLSSIPNTVTSCSAAPCKVIWSQNALDALFKGSSNYWWSTSNPDVNNSNWWPTYGRPLETTQVVSYVSDQPYFVVEQYGYIPDDLSPSTRAQGIGVYYYRITSRGTGGLSQSGLYSNPNQAYLQSIYAKRFN